MLRRRYFNQQKIVKKEANGLFEGHLSVRYFSMNIEHSGKVSTIPVWFLPKGQIPIFLREHSFCAMAQK